MNNEQIKWMEKNLDEMVARRMENTGESFEDACKHIAQELMKVKESKWPNWTGHVISTTHTTMCSTDYPNKNKRTLDHPKRWERVMKEKNFWNNKWRKTQKDSTHDQTKRPTISILVGQTWNRWRGIETPWKTQAKDKWRSWLVSWITHESPKETWAKTKLWETVQETGWRLLQIRSRLLNSVTTLPSLPLGFPLVVESITRHK